MSCSGVKEYVKGPCAVCSLLDGDKEKKDVAWCNTCSVHICKQCESDWIRRVEAFIKQRVVKYL